MAGVSARATNSTEGWTLEILGTVICSAYHVVLIQNQVAVYLIDVR